jgi:peptide/nickel transport system permease protein
MITIFGYSLSGLLSGAALTEIITGWPGLGSIILQAVRSQDLFLVMGSMLMGGILLIAGNLVADILLAWSDPRIQYK